MGFNKHTYFTVNHPPTDILLATVTMSSSAPQKKTGMNSNPKKDSILELAKMMDAVVRVKCSGGRELQGTLRGYDELVNLVLDDCDEFLRGACYSHYWGKFRRTK